MKQINLFVPFFRKEEVLAQISECLDKGWTGLGFKTQEFEERWKEYTGLPNAHFLNSNTSGLHLAVKILKDVNKWKDGDEIISTPLTFVSTNHAILYERMKPVLADIDEYLCLDPKSVESLITKKTRAVIFVGVGGNVGKLKEITEICKKYNLKLILDAAHMSGSFVKVDDRILHVGHESDVSVFSFQAVKNLPTADSGMICFKNNDYDQLARKLSWLGIDKDTYQRTKDDGVYKGSYKWEYDVIDAGYKYHGNSIMAGMGLVALKYLEKDNSRRREICKMYEKAFDTAKIKHVKVSPETHVSSRHLFQIMVENRDKVMEYLNSQGVYPGVHYRDNTVYSLYNNQSKNCPNSRRYSDSIISLPLHMKLEDEDVQYVIEKTIEANKIYNS